MNTEPTTRTRTKAKTVGAGLASAREGNNTPQITYATDGTCTIEITKQIQVVYENQDVIRDINSKAEGKTTIYYPENHLTIGGETKNEVEAEAREIVKQDYKVKFKAIKVWEDNNNEKGKRPESVTIEIRIMPNDQAIEKELKAENNWTYEEATLPKYNTTTGEKIRYIVTERETNAGDLEYYNEAKIEEAETIVGEGHESSGMTQYTYTITNQYKLKETDLSTEVTMTGTEEITKKDEEIDYTIHLTGEIKEYIGEGKIKIVDKLPYRIDETKGNLAGGIYNNENKTITWEVDLPHINTEETGESHKIDITKQIKVVYTDIDLEQEKLTNQVTGTVELYETEEKDEREATADTLIKVQGKVIVKYIDKATGKEIKPETGTYSYEITGKVGENYKAEKKEIADYIYVEGINEEGKIKEKEQIAIFYYETAKTKVIVKYQDEEGNNIKEEEIIEGKVGDKYKVEQKEIEDYDYVEVKGTEEGEMTKEEIVITYVYKKQNIGKLTIKYLDLDTDEEIEDYTYEITGKIGDEYETEKKEIPYYVYVKDTENTKGTLEKEGEVKYYYRKQIFNFSIEKTISSITLNGEKVRISDNKLAKIEVKTSEIANVELIIKYNIKVTNEGELAGKAKIQDILPDGYEIVDANDWKTTQDGNLEADIELKPEESKNLELTIKWKNSEKNLGSKENKAQIVSTENEAGYKDTKTKDDKSEATVIVSIKTGVVVSIIIVIMILGSLGICGYVIITTTHKMGKGPDINKIKFLMRK